MNARFCSPAVRLLILLLVAISPGAFSALPTGTVQFITDVYGRNENAGDAALTVIRNGDTNSGCSVNWSVTGGSAVALNDYSPTSGTLNFAAGETFKNISLLIVNDALVESNETVNLTLSGAVNATISFPSNAVLTIFDNDVSNPPPSTVVQFITDVYGRNENAGDASLTVTRNGDTSNACSVNWSVTGGSATSGTDYSPASGTLNFAAFETFKNISLIIVDDALFEGDETVNLALSGAANATIGFPSNAVLTIFNNDVSNPPPVIQFVSSVYGRFEYQTAPLNLERLGDTNVSCSVEWSYTGGTAVPFSDFFGGSSTINFAAGQTIAALPISIIDDAVAESDETAGFSLQNPFNATLGSPTSATLTIYDNDSSNPPPATVVQFITDVYGRNENAGDASLTVTRSGDTSNACSVNWSVTGGSATAPADYSPTSGTLNFAAFETFKNISLLIVDDGIVESNETVNLTLSGAVNASIGFPSNAVLTIFDNDVSNPPPATVVQFITDVYGRNENAGDASLTVTRSGDTSNACSVNWSVTGGSATAPADYSPTSGTLNFAAFETFKNISLLIVDDGIVESNETVNLTLSGAVNASIGFPSNAVLTIFDNDVSNPPPSADVSMRKTSGAIDPVTVGQQITYTLYASNAGPNISSNVIVRDAIPSGTVYVNATGGACTYYPNFQRVDCDVGHLASGGSAIVSVTVQVTNAGDIVNFANAYGSTPDPNTDNNARGVTNTAVVSSADLVVTKEASTNWIRSGEQVFYTITVSNRGPGQASSVVVSDPLPPGLQYDNAEACCGGCTNINGTVFCDLGTLAPGETAGATIGAFVIVDGNITNTASVTATEPDTFPADNSSSVVIMAAFPPVIIVPPLSDEGLEGGTANFSVMASGTAPLSYQWRFNEVNLPGEVANTLTRGPLHPGHVGFYDVVVSNQAGVVTSGAAYLGLRRLYQVNVSAGANGSVSPNGMVSLYAGENLALNATPNLNYVVDVWFVDGSPVQTGGNAYTLQYIQTNHAVFVSFKFVQACEGIAINFVDVAHGAGATLTSSAVAGAVPQSGWVNAFGASGALTLAGGALATWYAPDTGFLPIAAVPPDFALMRGYLDSQSITAATVSISGLNYGSYDVYVYCAGDNTTSGETRVGRYTLNGSQSRYAKDNPTSPDFGGTYIASTSTSGGVGAAEGNYVVFTNVTGSSFGVSAQGDYTSGTQLRAPLNAIQVVPHGVALAVPLSLRIHTISNGCTSLTIFGSPNQYVSLEVSSDLITWTPLTTFFNGPGTLPFCHAYDPATPQLFYRATQGLFPHAGQPLAFGGFAPDGSYGALQLQGNLDAMQFSWASSNAAFGALNSGWLNASQWTYLPGSLDCPSRVVFNASGGGVQYYVTVFYGYLQQAIVNVVQGLTNFRYDARSIKPMLIIHKPPVLDAAETAIPEAEKFTKGAQTFVNLDNDDGDAKYDTGTNDVAVVGENEMCRVELKIEPLLLNVGAVRLEALAGGTSIKVWQAKDKGTAYLLGTPLNLATDFVVTNGAKVKTLWVEGIEPSTSPQAIKLQMTYSNNAPPTMLADKAALTVIGIDSIKWVGRNNSTNHNNTLDDDPNFKNPDGTGLAPEAVRVFPDARMVAGAVEANPRDKVDVEVKLSVKPIEPLPFFFRSLDVDDPTAALRPVDNETNEQDNRGTVPARNGQFVKANGTSDETGGIKERSFTNQTETMLFRTTMQPGDNFRLAGNGDRNFVAVMKNDDFVLNVPADAREANTNKQRIIDDRIAGDPAVKEIRNADKYASKVLTVWRFVHVEVDKMRNPTNTIQNNAVGNVERFSSNILTLTSAGLRLNDVAVAGLDDGSPSGTLPDSFGDFDGGRFETGRLTRLGTNSVPLNIISNGNLYFTISNAVSIAFAASKAGTNQVGNVTNLAFAGVRNTLVVDVAMPTNHFQGGTVSMGGSNYVILANTNLEIVTTTKVLLPFEAVDDDAATVPDPDTSRIGEAFNPAYVAPVLDGTNDNDLKFVVNIAPAETAADIRDEWKFDGVAHEASTIYWMVYVRGSFQHIAAEDADPRFEGSTLGIVDAINGRGANIYEEVLRAGEFTSDLAKGKSEGYTVAHEIGHLFGGDHRDGCTGRNRMGAITNCPGAGLMSQTSLRVSPKFNGVTLDKIRGINHP